eukprot:c5479_g1_i1 orf=156-992(+)
MEVDQLQQLREFPVWKAVRRRLLPSSSFFAAGNVERELLAKQVSLEITEEEKAQISRIEEEQSWETQCPIEGCKVKLKGVDDLEAHYAARHISICCVCSRVFPTTRLLNLHVAEVHDSFFQAKSARGYPMYECLIEGCGTRFQSDSSRHQHLVDKHKFPRTFCFHKKRHLSQRQRQRFHSKQENKALMQAMKCKKQDKEASQIGIGNSSMQMDVDILTSGISRLSTADHVPSVVSFGHRHNRGFTSYPKKQREERSRQPKKIEDQHSIAFDAPAEKMI